MKTLDIKKYFNQPTSLPSRIENFIQQANDSILLFSLVDLNQNQDFIQDWIILGQNHLYLDQKELISKLEYHKIDQVIEYVGRSCHQMTIILKKQKAPIHLYYTNRQKIIFSQLIYLLREQMKNKPLSLTIDAQEQYQNSLLHHLYKEQSGEEKSKKNVLLRLLSYLLPYKNELIIGSIGAVLTTLVSLVPPYISGYMIDHVVKPFQSGGLTQSKAMEVSWIILAGLLCTYILKEFFIWLRLKKMSILGEKVARDLRKQLFDHLQSLEMDFYSTKQTGSIISRVSSDTDRIWDFLAFGIIEVCISLVMLLGLSLVLISLDLKLGLLMTLPVPIFIYAIFAHGKRMQTLFLRAWRKWSAITDILSDSIPGIQVVKAFNQEKKEIKRFAARNKDAYEVFVSIHDSWTKFWPILILGIQLIMLSVWIFAIPRLISPENNLDHLKVGTFVSFLLYMTMFIQPIEIIGQMARMLNRATSSAYRIFEILDTKPGLKNSKNSKRATKILGKIEFKDIIFSYDGVRQVLKGISFSIKPGEMIGLVGPSGGGKTTITKLISRFYDATSGEILIDNTQIKDYELGSYRKNIGMVLQDPYLFHGTIAENISYGLEDCSCERIIEVAKIANAHEFIMKFARGYDTVVGERGQTLSGGERQRISIARAILHDPKILILDEATSAVDTETERKIQDALDNLVEGRTVIAIAHRLSTLRKANRIFVIKEGEIVEEGSHHQLLQKDGEYKKLQNMQKISDELMNQTVIKQKEENHEILH